MKEAECILKQTIYEQYNLRMERKTKFRQYDAFWANRVLYILVPLGYMDKEELEEIQQLSEYMLRQHQDIYVCSFVKNKSGEYTTEIEDSIYGLLRIPYVETRADFPIGSELAKFHQRARAFPKKITAMNRIGQWKSLWIKRIDQMESFYYEMVRNHPVDYFDKLFVESFPYYLGLTENAIQYLVDTEMDDQPMMNDAGTLCHHRFSKTTWLQNQQFAKLPLDWVFDHASRDISEYIRSECVYSNSFDQAKINQFTRDYEQVSPLSTFSWRLTYARLIFPVYYLECIENYYTSSARTDKKWHEDRLTEILNFSPTYERLLKSFYDTAAVPIRNYKIPILDWV